MPARSREYKRKPPEPEVPLPTTPTKGRLPKQFPVPETRLPPVPSSALEGLVQPAERSPAFAGLAGQQPERRQNLLQRISAILRGPVYPGPSIAERIFGDTSIYPGPSLAEQALGTPARKQGVPSLFTPVGQDGVQLTGYEAALAEARKRAAEFSDPMNTIEAAAGHVMVSFENDYSPPFIMYEVQAHWGWTDAQMRAAGYVRGMGGWKLDLGGEEIATTTSVSGDGGGVVPSWSFPSSGGGGSRNSYAGSSLINWRI